jgi:hypothetical protein
MNVGYLEIAKILFGLQTNRISNPFKLNFAITYKCGFKCKTCGIWRKYYRQSKLKKELSGVV